jgi:hypothetical protein
MQDFNYLKTSAFPSALTADHSICIAAAAVAAAESSARIQAVCSSNACTRTAASMPGKRMLVQSANLQISKTVYAQVV